MKYYLIAGEASGDLHASNLMKALKREDPAAEALLSGQFHTGDTLVLTVRENNLAIAPLVR